MRAWWMAICLAAIAAGCTQPRVERSATVSGKVTLGGAALTAGTVLFMTDDGHAAAETLQPDGSYLVRCRPDRYKVAVTPPPPVDPLTAGAGASPPGQASGKPIPKRYHDFTTSGLTVEVKAGENQFDMALTP